MSERTAVTFPALNGFNLLVCEGPDAEAFLQAQTMNDVRPLAPGHWQWNGWLNPKGRVIALFALLRLDDGRYWLLLPDYPADALLPRLQRYVFRSRLKLAISTNYRAAADLAPAETKDSPADAFARDGETYRLDMSGDGGRRDLLLLPLGHPALAAADAGTDQAWLTQDLLHGLPRLPESQSEAWTPQMLSLDRLKAYSLKKGCYPGQEIVARTHYLGRAKRELALLAGENLGVGETLRRGEIEIGTLVSAAADGRLGLAIVARDAADPLPSASGDRFLRPLFSGLERPL